MSFARQSLGSLVALVFGLVVSVALARALGPEGRGEYQLAVRVAGLAIAFGQWGILEVLLQMVAERPESTGRLVGTSLALALAGTVVGGGLVLLALPWLELTVLRGVDGWLVTGAVVGSLAAIAGLLGRRFIQLGNRLAVYNGLDVARNALFLALAVTFTVVLGWSAAGALGGWLVAELALAVCALLYVRARIASGWRFDARLARTLLVAGAPVQVGLVATYLGNEGGAYALNASLDLASVGVYTVALGVARLVLQVSMALRTTLQARLAGPGVDASTLTARVTRHGIVWMLAVALGLAAGSPLVAFVFGRDFSAAGPALVWMLPGMVAYGVMQLLAGHLLRVGRRGVLALSSWAFAMASIALQALGAHLGGLVGASAGMSVAYFVGLAIVAVAFCRESGVPASGLLPGSSEVAYYVDLSRRILRVRGGPPPAARTTG